MSMAERLKRFECIGDISKMPEEGQTETFGSVFPMDKTFAVLASAA